MTGTTTTNPDFGFSTDANEVAAAYPSAIRGKIILVTGVNKLGIGYATCQALASQGPKTIIFAGRSAAKLEECLAALHSAYPKVDLRPLVIDLSSQQSVRRAAEEILAWDNIPQIDVLINNAGIMNLPERTLSPEGIEMHFATNHIGHFLLTNLLMPKLIASAKTSDKGMTRVINVSSLACFVSPLRASDINWEKTITEIPANERPNTTMMKTAGLKADDDMTYIPMGAYGASKCANSLFTTALNARVHDKYGVVSIVLHPGEIDSELQRYMDKEWREKAHKAMGIVPKTVGQGAATTIVAVCDPALGKPGLFLNDCQVWDKVPPHATDPTVAEKLWEVSEDLVKEKFSW